VSPGSQVPFSATVIVPANATPGIYNIKINTQDTTGAPSHSFTIALTVVTPNFLLSEPIAFPVVNATSTTTSGAISIASQYGFSATVSLSCSLKSGTGSCSVAPASVNSFPATANVTVNATSLSAGSYQATVQGVSGSITNTLAIPFNVGDYQLSGTQTLSLPPGGQAIANLTIAASTYYSGMVNASCDASALAGTICTTSPATPTIPVSVSPGAQVPLTATIDVTNDAVPGTYNIKINTQDTTGAPTHSLTIALTVVPDFGVSSTTTPQTVTAGQTAGPYNIIVQPVGTSFNNPVTLSCTGGVPAGAQCSFTPNPITPGNNAADVVLSISTAAAPGVRQPAQQTALFYLLGLTMPGIVLLWGATSHGRRSRRSVLTLLAGVLLALLMLSCAGGTGVSPGGSCGAAPSVPTGLAASSITSTSATLNWNPSSVASDCSVNSYTVYENGTSVGGPTSTSFAVTGLLPSTPQAPENYNFQIAASDAAGISSPSGAVTVTTLQAPTYTVTVTGVSGSLTHSTTVTLIVLP